MTRSGGGGGEDEGRIAVSFGPKQSTAKKPLLHFKTVVVVIEGVANFRRWDRVHIVDAEPPPNPPLRPFPTTTVITTPRQVPGDRICKHQSGKSDL